MRANTQKGSDLDIDLPSPRRLGRAVDRAPDHRVVRRTIRERTIQISEVDQHVRPDAQLSHALERWAEIGTSEALAIHQRARPGALGQPLDVGDVSVTLDHPERARPDLHQDVSALANYLLEHTR